MSQLIAFAFRRSRTDEDESDANPSSTCPGMICSQNSSETTSTTLSEWKENYICIPRRRGVTVTPEGLLPRKPLAQLRAELLPDDDDGDDLLLVERKPSLEHEKLDQENSPHLVVSTYHQSHHLQKLPPFPSRSWSTRSSYPWGSSSSPVISPTTLTSAWTAESPNLVPGQARTAVGNLVALQQQQQQDPPGLTPLQEKKNEWSPNYSPQEERVENMFSPLSRKEEKESRITLDRLGEETESAILFSPVLSEKIPAQVAPPSSTTGSSKKLLVCNVAHNNSTSNPTAHAPWTQQFSSHPSLDQDMKKIKARNQHQAKEELCLQILERLQDNVELVTKINGMFPWFGNSAAEDVAHGGLMSGFPEEKRYRISDKLDLFLTELNSGVQTEEFFFSPGKADMTEYNDEKSHRELRKALGFCKVLVQMAIPEEENEMGSLQGTNEVGRWRFLFSEEIGLDLPQTPHKGNSSFFSLPESEAATPMTSNVSLGASTLTTRPQTIAGMPGPPQNGLDLRHALQSFVSAIQTMGEACSKFANMESSTAFTLVRTAEKIKKTYGALMDLNVLDLRFMVDAFDFVVDESTEIESPVMRAETLGSGMIANVSIHETSSFEMEDLRREVGSIDYSDQEEEERFHEWESEV